MSHHLFPLAGRHGADQPSQQLSVVIALPDRAMSALFDVGYGVGLADVEPGRIAVGAAHTTWLDFPALRGSFWVRCGVSTREWGQPGMPERHVVRRRRAD
jgi:hypothetical protein